MQGPEALEAACRGRHVQTAQLLVAAGLKVVLTLVSPQMVFSQLHANSCPCDCHCN